MIAYAFSTSPAKAPKNFRLKATRRKKLSRCDHSMHSSRGMDNEETESRYTQR